MKLLSGPLGEDFILSFLQLSKKKARVWDSCAGNFDKKETVLSRIEIFLLWLLPLLS